VPATRSLHLVRSEAPASSPWRAAPQRANWEPRRLSCVPAGMARKRAQRERDAQEAAIDAGLLQRKGLGKKRERATRAALAARGARGAKTGRAGLREDNGAFRAGVLRVRVGAGERGRGRGRGRAARGGGARGARRGGGRGGGRGGRE